MEHTEVRKLLTEIVQLEEENRKLKIKMEEKMRVCKCLSESDRKLRDMALNDATRRHIERNRDLDQPEQKCSKHAQ